MIIKLPQRGGGFTRERGGGQGETLEENLMHRGLRGFRRPFEYLEDGQRAKCNGKLSAIGGEQKSPQRG